MPFGGMTPYPRRLGGGRPRVQMILDSLNADRGTAFDATNRDTTVYVNDMAIARAISAAWGTNERLGNIWVPARMPSDVLARWEKILAISPGPTETEAERRARLAMLFSHFGKSTINGRVVELLSAALGDAFVAVEYIGYDNAVIMVPDGTYPWGTTGSSPWSSTVAHVLVRLQKPDNWTEYDFYQAAGRVPVILEPLLPVWTTLDWYRPGPAFAPISDGPSAAGFYLDDDHNLDNEVLDNTASAFSPLSVVDCRLWLRADLGLTESGGAVSAWADQSGAGDANRNATQGTAANQPTYVSSDANFNNRPVVSFDGVDNYLSTGTWTGGPYSQPVTVYAAFRHTVDGGYVFDDIDGSSRLAFTTGTTGGFSFVFAGSATVNTNTAQSTTLIAAVVFDGAGSAAYVNDSATPVSSGNPGSNGLKSMTLGARFTAANFLTGQIAEVLAYSGAHDATTRQQIMQYMGGRYGVSVP